ncbi:MAG: uroporphyrinogen-III C-methyltransferase [Acidiphilium sp.]|nr:uroporphyrinogen-III C-methyltransferase [Acidiphilium sp.]MDD4935575.1 uroporphyrinogen-III C-methyltransferase [Acidiphilium sp.]
MTVASAVAHIMETLPRLQAGQVWLAGAGPGDPAHLTLLTLSGLDQADVVVHDALVDPAVLALAHPAAARIPAGKRGGKPSAIQADITAQLISLARDGKRVLRLKGGDPFMFGRGGEEALTLAAHGIPFRIIPGLTSGLASMASALIPLTLRGVNQAVVLATGHGADRTDGMDWAALARLGQPIVLYMAITNLAVIASALIAGGLPGETAAAAIASATLADQRIVVATLATLADAIRREAIAAPAIIVIGAVVETRARLLALLPALEFPPS